MDDTTLYWLAGLLEGEGTFLPGPPSRPNQPVIRVFMTDEDIVAKIASLWRVSYHELKSKRYEEHNWKTPYTVQLRGERAARLMEKLRPLMGRRRQSQIDIALASYTEQPFKLSKEDVIEIRHRLAKGDRHKDIADDYQVSRTYITKINTGERWGRLTI